MAGILLMDGFTEEERVVHAEGDPTLGEMAERAREAWAALPAEEEAP